MKIAICLSGCPRDWREGKGRIEELLKILEKQHNVSLDLYYFLSFWTFLVPSINFEHYKEIQKKYKYDGDSRMFTFRLSEVEQENLLDLYNPSRFTFHSYDEMLKLLERRGGECWHLPSSLLMLDSLNLRRQFEQQHRFEFDIVIWSRTDLIFDVVGTVDLFTKGLLGGCLYRTQRNGKVLQGFRDQFFLGKGTVVDLAAYVYRLCTVDVDYREQFIEEIFEQELLRNNIPIDCRALKIDISRKFEESLLESDSL